MTCVCPYNNQHGTVELQWLELWWLIHLGWLELSSWSQRVILCIINPGCLELPLAGTIFHGSKPVWAIEVLLYIYKINLYLTVYRPIKNTPTKRSNAQPLVNFKKKKLPKEENQGCYAIAYVYLHLWYKYVVRTVTQFVRFTFREIKLNQNLTGTSLLREK